MPSSLHDLCGRSYKAIARRVCTSATSSKRRDTTAQSRPTRRANATISKRDRKREKKREKKERDIYSEREKERVPRKRESAEKEKEKEKKRARAS